MLQAFLIYARNVTASAMHGAQYGIEIVHGVNCAAVAVFAGMRASTCGKG